MRKLSVAVLLFAAGLRAHNADVAYFRALMLPANERPLAVDPLKGKGAVDIIAHLIRDEDGQITSGTVEFTVHISLAANNTATGLDIHRGDSQTVGSVVINTGLSAGTPQALKGGGDVVHRNAPVLANDNTALTALRDLMNNPSGFYVNIQTPDFPGGIMRGQLQPAISRVLIGQMSSANEVPPVTTNATGNALVIALATVDSQGALTSAATYMETTYNIVGEQGNFSGFHIHVSPAGVNGSIAISSGIPPTTTIDSSGAGLVGPFYTDIDLTDSLQVQGFLNLYSNPSADYINIHTNLHPGGIMRAQLRNADTMVFTVNLYSSNETGTVHYQGDARSLITLHTIRNEDGTIATGSVFFDVNLEFSGPATFTGLHIHDGGLGVNGSVSIPEVPTYSPNFSTDTGVGNFFGYTPPVTGLPVATLNDIVQNPENHYANLHTTSDPGGSARGQLAPIVSATPVVAAAIAADLDKAATTVAPGGLLSIFGSNLVKTSADLTGWAGLVLPNRLNGTSVTIGGKAAAIIYVSPNQINAQVPVDVPVGTAQVVVTSTVGPGASFPVTVAATAPAIFFSPVAAVLKNVDFSLVSAANPAKAGDVILMYTTGLGQTTPVISTGTLVPGTGTAATNVPVTATIGGKDATVVYAIASPGFVGLYQVAITVPSGVSGTPDIVLKQGTTTSNSVKISVQ